MMMQYYLLTADVSMIGESKKSSKKSACALEKKAG
jgi:hypothetical protein